MTIYRSSHLVERQFCSVCGCHFTYRNLERNHKEEEKGEEPSIDVMLGTLDETILKGNLEIIPRRFAYYGDAPEWMKKILPTEEQIKHAV